MTVLESLQKEFDILNRKLDIMFFSATKSDDDMRRYKKIHEDRFDIDYEC